MSKAYTCLNSSLTLTHYTVARITSSIHLRGYSEVMARTYSSCAAWQH